MCRVVDETQPTPRRIERWFAFVYVSFFLTSINHAVSVVRRPPPPVIQVRSGTFLAAATTAAVAATAAEAYGTHPFLRSCSSRSPAVRPCRMSMATAPRRFPGGMSDAVATELPLGAVELKGHTRCITCLLALPDGERLATACPDKGVRVFSATSGECLRTLVDDLKAVTCLAALGGDIVVSGSDCGALRLWDVSTGEPLFADRVGRSIRSLARLRADRFMVGTDRRLLCFSHRDGREVAKVHEQGGEYTKLIASIGVLDTRVVTASLCMFNAVVWSADTFEQMAVLQGHTSYLVSVAMSEGYIVTGDARGRMRVYDTKTLQFENAFECLVTTYVHFWFVLAGERHALSSVNYDGSMQLVSLPTGKLVARVKAPFRITCATVSEGGWIATSGYRGEAIVFPPPASAAEAGIFREHIDAMRRASRARIVQLALAVTGRRRR
jgi:WD40 repeat protein